MISSQSRLNQIVELPDGRKLGFDRYGCVSGRPLLYFHGGASSKLDIAFADSYLKEQGVELIAPDRPGIGQSTRAPGRTLLDWSNDIKNFLKILGYKEAMPLIGWSLGGPYALVCAYALPEQINITAVSGSCGPLAELKAIKDLDLLLDRLLFSSPESLHWMIAFLLSIYEKLPIELVRADLINQLKAASDREIVKNYTKEDCSSFIHASLTNNGWGVIDDYEAIKKPWGFKVSQIKNPVHVFHGANDTLSPISQAHYLAEHIPHSKLHIIPEQGHFLLQKNLLEFLKSLNLIE